VTNYDLLVLRISDITPIQQVVLGAYSLPTGTQTNTRAVYANYASACPSAGNVDSSFARPPGC
jgi:hypothetical protein